MKTNENLYPVEVLTFAKCDNLAMNCKNCKHWHKDKDSSDVDDDAAWGECDIIKCGSYGSDSICMDFE